MSTLRRAAAHILAFAVRHASPRGQSWGAAMLREMDFIDNDWSALRWALGSTTAVWRYSLIERLSDRRNRRARPVREWRRGLVSVLSGMAAAAGILALSVTTLSTVTRQALFDPSQRRLFGELFVVGMPLTIYLLGALLLRRANRRVSPGVFAAGATLIAHSLMYVATHK